MDTREIGRMALRRGLEGMGLSRSFISELLNGKSDPSMKLARRIEAELGVSSTSWLNGDPCAEMFRRIVENEQTK
jgi:transcriptional regulator with XRE-family HTH domain